MNLKRLQADKVLERKVNIFFLLALIFVFILVSNAQEHIQILTGTFLAGLLSLTAFILTWLTIDGAFSALIFGSIAYGLGGLVGASVVVAFFASSSLISKDLISIEGFLGKRQRRDGKQVWANGFWFAIWILIWYLTGIEAFMIASVTAIAVATSDTWATEIGDKRLKSKTYLITTFDKVQPGTDGGVSIQGTLASIAGAVFISVIYWLFDFNINLWIIAVIAATGFLGSLIDSYIGARFQNTSINLPGNAGSDSQGIYVGNNFVNWISTGIASCISLILILITNI